MVRQILAILVVLSLIGAALYELALANLPDPPPCEKLRAEHVRFIVVDASDKLESVPRGFISESVKDLVTGAPGRARVVLLQPNASSSPEPFERGNVCTPDSADFIRDTILLPENDVQKRTMALDKARNDISAAADVAINQSVDGADQSPLIETMIAISGRHDFAVAKVREIYVFGDMRQHSSVSSVYESEKGKKTYFCPTGFRYADLQGATVHVKLVVRDRILAEDRLRSYWEKLMQGVNGRIDWPQWTAAARAQEAAR